MDLSEAVRIRIKNLIEERELNVSKLSTMAGISRATLSKFLSGQRKYLRIDIYSERNMLLGTRYIDLEKATSSQEFKVFYELEDSTSYEISIVNEKTDQELKIIPDEWTKPEIVLATALTFLIFWG